MNELEQVKKQTMLQTTHAWISKLSAFANSSNLQFDDYQKEIVVNTVRKIQENGYDIFGYDQNNVADVLYQTAFLRLNPSAIPRHCYFINRDVYENGKKAGSKLEVAIEGEGNDEILRQHGYKIEKILPVWVIREFDEFEEGYYQGINYVPPTWRPKKLKIGEKKGRIIKVIYPIVREDGTAEYWGADREDLQPIISKHIEQNLSGYRRADKNGFEKFMKGLKELTFDEIIEKYQDEAISYTAYGKSNTSKIILDSYTGATGEAMIIRKLRNLAIRTFPKNFDTTVVAKIYEKTFEEKYDKPLIAETTQDKIENEKKEQACSVVIEDTTKVNSEDVIASLKDKTQATQTQKQEVEIEKVEIIEEKQPQKEVANVEIKLEIDEELDEFFL